MMGGLSLAAHISARIFARRWRRVAEAWACAICRWRKRCCSCAEASFLFRKSLLLIRFLLPRWGPWEHAGKVHRDISGENRGPFDVVPVQGVPSYPLLWAHVASRERRLVVSPDSQGEIRPGLREKAEAVWATATRLHFNLDFRLNSQSLAACLTPKPTLGGRAWPNFTLHNSRWEKNFIALGQLDLGADQFLVDWEVGNITAGRV